MFCNQRLTIQLIELGFLSLDEFGFLAERVGEMCFARCSRQAVDHAVHRSYKIIKLYNDSAVK